MENSFGNREAVGLRFSLGLKLAAALLFAALLMLVFLFGYFGPAAKVAFLDRGSGLIESSSDTLRKMALENVSESEQVLFKLIRRALESREHDMMDVPLSLYGGDEGRIRRALMAVETGRNEQLRSNVAILTREMERRALDKIDRSVQRFIGEQAVVGAEFAGDIRRSYLLLAGAVFFVLFLVLGLGLYRTVVHPLRQLRRGTQAVARGDLDVEVPLRSKDEVGGLAADFAAMVRQLRESRESIRKKNIELETLNRNLEAEVARKTSHLEQTLDDLRRTQRQLIHAEKMASIGTLAGGVAHEFNNLIGGIRGCAAEVLEMEEDADRREILGVILRAVSRAGEITDQLLRFSRQRTMRLESVDVTKALDEAILLIEPDARKRKVKVLHNVDACPPFLADGDGLHQVFLNLLTNALQAMPEGGELSVEGAASERELVVRVSDTGVGILADRIGRIFEPFFTTKDRESDPASRGTGLGLSVSYSIVEAHGGTLEVESEPGRGTTVTVRLPVTRQTPQDAMDAQATPNG